VLAVGLALLFGLRPWLDLQASPGAILTSLAATLPLAAGLFAMQPGRWRWADELTGLVRRFLHLLFRNAFPGAVLLVSLLAGVGEELLFRGVVQAGISDAWSTAAGLLIASLLFGAAHAVTFSYWIVATAMGLYLGLLYHWTGNLFVPIVVHALYDWIAIHYYLRPVGRRN
jgi:hypothetical protein